MCSSACPSAWAAVQHPPMGNAHWLRKCRKPVQNGRLTFVVCASQKWRGAEALAGELSSKRPEFFLAALSAPVSRRVPRVLGRCTQGLSTCALPSHPPCAPPAQLLLLFFRRFRWLLAWA